MTPFVMAVDALACHRLARLATQDRIFDRPRDAIVRAAYRRQGREAIEQPVPDVPGAWADVARADDDPPGVATLATCPHCMSVWTAAGVVLARRLLPKPWAVVAEVLALSAVAGLLTSIK